MNHKIVAATAIKNDADVQIYSQLNNSRLKRMEVDRREPVETFGDTFPF